MRLCILTFIISFILFSCSDQKGQNIKEGVWEVTIRMNVPEMSAQMSPWTYTQCLTPKEAVPQPQQGQPRKKCKVVKQDVKGGMVSWVA